MIAKIKAILCTTLVMGLLGGLFYMGQYHEETLKTVLQYFLYLFLPCLFGALCWAIYLFFLLLFEDLK